MTNAQLRYLLDCARKQRHDARQAQLMRDIADHIEAEQRSLAPRNLNPRRWIDLTPVDGWDRDTTSTLGHGDTWR